MKHNILSIVSITYNPVVYLPPITIKVTVVLFRKTFKLYVGWVMQLKKLYQNGKALVFF